MEFTMVFHFALVHVLLTAVAILVTNTHAAPKYPFLDPSLPWTERVNDLVDRLTLEELTQQVARDGQTAHTAGIDRLGIKPYVWGTECLRGDVSAGPATSFPQAIGLAATFSPKTVFNIARATGLEVRAKFNNYSAHEDYQSHHGASCWSPVINIMRDPRWGRNQETYGEDPFMNGFLSQAFVRGLQGDDHRYVLASAGCKHFDVYAGPENIPVSRHNFSADVSEKDWRMTFLPAFKMCIEAGSFSLMCSYNSINGVPACGNKKLLTEILRMEWGFNGYVVSDVGAISDIMNNHKYTNSTEDTAALAINAGCNLEAAGGKTPPLFNSIPQAVKQGKLTERTLREAVKPLFYTRMRLGLFDPPDMNPYTKLDPANFVQSQEHMELSIETAASSFVLLKNANNYLPLTKGKIFDTIAIVGPMADDVDGLFGDYHSDPDMRYTRTPRQGLSTLSHTVNFTPGCQNQDKCVQYNATALKQAVTGSELVIVCLGTGTNVESEGHDRTDINLPGKQLQLLQDAVMYSNGAPVVLMLFNAGPLDVSWAQASPRVPVIMACFFPAQAAGYALNRVFFAEFPGSSFGGRLPATWPASVNQYPAITNYTMEGRTYRYFKGEPLYPFGYGLSYASFNYTHLDIQPTRMYTDGVVNVSVTVRNTVPFDADEVVQVYVEWPSSSVAVPIRQLVGFDRGVIRAQEEKTFHFQITSEQLAVWDEPRGFIHIPGETKVYAGGQQPGQVKKVPSNILTGSFIVVGDTDT